MWIKVSVKKKSPINITSCGKDTCQPLARQSGGNNTKLLELLRNSRGWRNHRKVASNTTWMQFTKIQMEGNSSDESSGFSTERKRQLHTKMEVVTEAHTRLRRWEWRSSGSLFKEIPMCVWDIVTYCVCTCSHMCEYMCVGICACVFREHEKREESLRCHSLPPPPLWGRILTSLTRLDRLVGEHQGLADLHLPKLGLQMMHPTMPSYFFFNVASVDWTQALVICQHLANKAISSPAPFLFLLLFF